MTKSQINSKSQIPKSQKARLRRVEFAIARAEVGCTLDSRLMTNDEMTKSSGGKFVPAQATVARALVEYQAGSVVSREIVKKPTGRVTLFAFDDGEGLSEHTAPFDALVQILEGEAEITIAGAANRLGEGELILLPAGQPHALKALTRFKMILTMIRA